MVNQKENMNNYGYLICYVHPCIAESLVIMNTGRSSTGQPVSREHLTILSLIKIPCNLIMPPACVDVCVFYSDIFTFSPLHLHSSLAYWPLTDIRHHQIVMLSLTLGAGLTSLEQCVVVVVLSSGYVLELQAEYFWGDAEEVLAGSCVLCACVCVFTAWWFIWH